MAYAASIAITRKGNDYLVQITETEAGAATECSFQAPIRGRILRQQATKTAGSAATIDPILGNAVPYVSSTGILYHRSVCNTGSDNSVTTLYYISGSTPATGW